MVYNIPPLRKFMIVRLRQRSPPQTSKRARHAVLHYTSHSLELAKMPFFQVVFSIRYESNPFPLIFFLFCYQFWVFCRLVCFKTPSRSRVMIFWKLAFQALLLVFSFFMFMFMFMFIFMFIFMSAHSVPPIFHCLNIVQFPSSKVFWVCIPVVCAGL